MLASKSVPSVTLLERAGLWFLDSSIQEPTGGVARYYHSDSRRNARVSTEITGYSVSFLCWAHQQTGDRAYLDAAIRAGRYLIDAWDDQTATFPFEPVSDNAADRAYTYFFDTGIIIRGLLALWRESGDSSFLEKAKEAAVAMAFDFHAGVAVHPILLLPEKEALDYEPRWSRSPGCYQLKSAMAWRDVAEAAAQPELNAPYERMLAYSLETYREFLPGDSNPEKVMDRLHAYSYFLEALLPVASRPECARALAAGIATVGKLLRDIAPVFERSDVNAQILRVRLYAHHLGVVPLDYEAAAHEAAMAAQFQSADPDPSHHGGFWFGRKGTIFLPFLNPVSTAFCAQALTFWNQFQEGGFSAPITALV